MKKNNEERLNQNLFIINEKNKNDTIKLVDDNNSKKDVIDFYNNNNNNNKTENKKYNFEEDFITYNNNHNNDNYNLQNNFEKNQSFNNFKFNDYEENQNYFETGNNNFQYGDDDDENEQFTEGILIDIQKKNTNKLNILSSLLRSSQKFIFNNTINKEKLFGTKGLFKIENSNLFNPVFQCLSNIFPLTEYFLKDEHKNEINENNPLSSFGNISIAYAELLKIIWTKKLNNTFKNNKEGYYLNNDIDDRFKDVYCNLLNELGKTNSLIFKDNCELYNFFNYFLLIIHEDLKRNCDDKKIIINDNNEDNLENLYKNKWNNFKLINNSIIIDIFFGMNILEIKCSNCNKNNYIFENFNILPFSLNLDSLKKQNNFKIPSINNFYFIQCVIIPFNIEDKKKIVYYPLKKKLYDITKINDISKIISYIFNLEIIDFVPCIISDDYSTYKLICNGNEYLYEIFSTPKFIKIYFVLKKLKKLELKEDFENNMNLLQFFLNSKEIKIFEENKNNNNNFILGEEELGDSINLLDSAIKNFLSNKSYIKLISFYKTIDKNNKENSINKNILIKFQIPKFINIPLNSNLFDLYNIILSEFNLSKDQKFFSFDKIISNLINNKFDFEKEDIKIILSKMSKEFEKEVPFILTIKIERKPDIYINEFNTNKNDFYIPIPYINNYSLNKFIKLLQDNLLQKPNLMDIYSVKKFRINIIWLEKYKKNLFDMENNYELNELDEINPYNEISKVQKENNNKEIIDISNEIKLEHLIESFIKEINGYYSFCEYCNKITEGKKKFMFCILPNVIIFYFKRREFEIYNKIKIKFPINNILDLSNYVIDKNSKLKKYELIGIINYYYLTNHYNCFCKNPLQNKWYLFDDTDCCPINDIEKEIIYENVCCLIYKNIYFTKYD